MDPDGGQVGDCRSQGGAEGGLRRPHPPGDRLPREASGAAWDPLPEGGAAGVGWRWLRPVGGRTDGGLGQEAAESVTGATGQWKSPARVRGACGLDGPRARRVGTASHSELCIVDGRAVQGSGGSRMPPVRGPRTERSDRHRQRTAAPGPLEAELERGPGLRTQDRTL